MKRFWWLLAIPFFLPLSQNTTGFWMVGGALPDASTTTFPNCSDFFQGCGGGSVVQPSTAPAINIILHLAADSATITGVDLNTTDGKCWNVSPTPTGLASKSVLCP